MANPFQFDLDQLEQLNPDPAQFTVGGRVLVLKELSHKDYYDIVGGWLEIQGQLMAGIDPESIRSKTTAMLLRLFAPWNEDLTEAFFDDLSERKLAFLVTKAMEYQSAHQKDDEEQPKSPLGEFAKLPPELQEQIMRRARGGANGHRSAGKTPTSR